MIKNFAVHSTQRIMQLTYTLDEKLWFKEQHCTIIRSSSILRQLQLRRCIHIPLDHNFRFNTGHAYDPFDWQMAHSHSPTYHQAFRVFGPSGEILIYQIDYTNGWMALWNSTLAVYKTQPSALQTMGSWGSNSSTEEHSMHQHPNATHGTSQYPKAYKPAHHSSHQS